MDIPEYVKQMAKDNVPHDKDSTYLVRRCRTDGAYLIWVNCNCFPPKSPVYRIKRNKDGTVNCFRIDLVSDDPYAYEDLGEHHFEL